MNAALLIAAVVGFLWVFWGLYVLVMGIYRAHLAKRLTPVTTALSLPFVLLGYAMDVLTNITVASLVFLEPPREFLVTTRLQRHIASTYARGGWRKRLATWVCDHLLDVFDPTGDHC
jgi:hypothetical protein